MKKALVLSSILGLTLLATLIHAQSVQPKRYTATPTGFLVVLKQGDSIMPHLEAMAISENIPSASFTGMGFVNITFGFFNQQAKQYDPRSFADMELASMTGSVAWKQGKPSIHAHGVVSGKDFQCFGGHILSGTVSTGSLEITVVVHSRKLERKHDASIGADVLDLQ